MLDLAELPEGSQKTIVLVTDGEESCGGDLQAVVDQFRGEAQIELRIIGFGLSDKAAKTFDGIGTSFSNVFDADSLASALAEATTSNAQNQDISFEGTWTGTFTTSEKDVGQVILVVLLHV